MLSAQDNEQKLENAFEDAVGEDNNCLLSSGSPTKTLDEFGELTTPLKATIDIPGETSVVEQLPNKNTSGLEVLDGTFQVLFFRIF